MRAATAISLVLLAFHAGSGAVAQETSSVLYKDSNWGIVEQNGGKTCIVVLNTDDRRHAFHFLVDGELGLAGIGILRDFLPGPGYLTAKKTVAYLDLGPTFAHEFAFTPRFDTMPMSIEADIPWRDLGGMLRAFEDMHGATLTFAGGTSWDVKAPERQSAREAMDRCWNGAAKSHGTAALSDLSADVA